MKIQVLVAAINQTDHSLLDKLNIQSDVIVGNQTNFDSVERFLYKGFQACYLNFNERGVGLNRNNALMRATGDICLIADDDMVYEDGYVSIVNEAFKRLPNADVIIFNLKEKNPTRYIIPSIRRVNRFNYLRYGTARIAFKLDKIKDNGIYFNQCFGGGTEHSHGEDNIFLSKCFDAGLKIYACPFYIATLNEDRLSTWNQGYNEKYLEDQGILYYTISRRYAFFLCLQDAIRKHKEYKRSWLSALRIMTSAYRDKK